MAAVVLYHDSCPDGFCAAYVAQAALREDYGEHVRMIPVKYHQPVPRIAGEDVYLLDFCYPRPIMEEIGRVSNMLVVLDHHATAKAALDGFVPANNHYKIVFDMTRSGAGITWDYFYPELPRPWVVNYIEDRDLWAWKLPDSHEINAYLGTLPYDFAAWDSVQKSWQNLNDVAAMGRAVLQKVQKYCSEMTLNVMTVPLLGRDVPIVNAPHINISELLADLVPRCGMSMGWHQDGTGRYVYSVRSDDTLHAGEFAKRFGGGGHAKAAGFFTNFPPSPEVVGLFEQKLKELEAK